MKKNEGKDNLNSWKSSSFMSSGRKKDPSNFKRCDLEVILSLRKSFFSITQAFSIAFIQYKICFRRPNRSLYQFFVPFIEIV